MIRRGLHTPQNARVLYLDMNAFFASVEQQRRPELRNKPVAVVSHNGPAGTVLAASYEAKAFGIKTGMRLKEAKPLCPGMIITETEAGPYRDVHKRFMAIVRDVCGPEVYAKSIDEAVIPLSPNWFGSETAHQLARTIKARFREELGEYIRCSIGIAPNTFLGKLGTNLRKPDGLIEVTLENTRDILEQLALTDLTGIAERYARRLTLKGIATPVDFYDAEPEFLRRHFGIWGQYWWWKLHGFEPDHESGPLKSMSHEHALKHWVHSREEVVPVIDKLADRLIHRLRRNHFQALNVGVFLSTKGGPPVFLERSLTAGNQTYETLLGTIHLLAQEVPEHTALPIRKVGIVFGRIVPAAIGTQLSIFDLGRSERASDAIEHVRSRFGFKAIQRASVARLGEHIAKEQLGFGRVKDV